MHKIKLLILFLLFTSFHSFCQTIEGKIDTTLLKNFDVKRLSEFPAYQPKSKKNFSTKVRTILYPKRKGYQADFISYKGKLYSKKEIPNILDTIRFREYLIKFDSIPKKIILIIKSP